MTKYHYSMELPEDVFEYCSVHDSITKLFIEMIRKKQNARQRK